MLLSPAGYELIKTSEGFRAYAYNDAAGFATIGYGHKMGPTENYPDGIDETFADSLLNDDVDQAQSAIARLVKVTLAQGQFDALTDWVFNLGSWALQNSTLLAELNAGNYTAAAAQILLWDHARVNGVETVMPGLQDRRRAEYNLFSGQVNT